MAAMQRVETHLFKYILCQTTLTKEGRTMNFIHLFKYNIFTCSIFSLPAFLTNHSLNCFVINIIRLKGTLILLAFVSIKHSKEIMPDAPTAKAMGFNVSNASSYPTPPRLVETLGIRKYLFNTDRH